MDGSMHASVHYKLKLLPFDIFPNRVIVSCIAPAAVGGRR